MDFLCIAILTTLITITGGGVKEGHEWEDVIGTFFVAMLLYGVLKAIPLLIARHLFTEPEWAQVGSSLFSFLTISSVCLFFIFRPKSKKVLDSGTQHV